MLQEIIFIALSVLVVAAAVMAVGFKSTLYNAFSLMLCLSGIAGIFLFLHSEFVAVMEIIVYVGAVAIAIVFAIMFSPPHFMTQPGRKFIKWLRSFGIAALFFAVIYRVVTITTWNATEAGREGDYSARALGKMLLGAYALPFEIISLVLFIAILGALLMAKKGGSIE